MSDGYRAAVAPVGVDGGNEAVPNGNDGGHLGRRNVDAGVMSGAQVSLGAKHRQHGAAPENRPLHPIDIRASGDGGRSRDRNNGGGGGTGCDRRRCDSTGVDGGGGSRRGGFWYQRGWRSFSPDRCFRGSRKEVGQGGWPAGSLGGRHGHDGDEGGAGQEERGDPLPQGSFQATRQLLGEEALCRRSAQQDRRDRQEPGEAHQIRHRCEEKVGSQGRVEPQPSEK